MIRNTVQRTIEQYDMLAPDAPVLVAVSGGLDSMVLLHLLLDGGYPVTVVHVDHGLRGGESDADRAFVEDQCQAMGVPCLVTKVDAATCADEEGISVQMAARSLRYAWFRECMQRTGIPVLATAHHQDDVLETLLMDLLRGVGVVGLGGIPPLVDGIFRPLINVERITIEEFARVEGIIFREDASNADTHYLRNRVRHELIPVLEEFAPGARRTLGRTAHLLRELSALAKPVLAGEMSAMRSPRGWWRAPLCSSKYPLLLLREMLQGYTVHPDDLSRILYAVQKGSVGAMFTVGESQLVVDREELMIVPAVDPPTTVYCVTRELELPAHCPVSFMWDEAASVQPPFSNDTVYLNADHLSFPLVLRPWRQGDRIRPLGMPGSKLVSDVLIDAHVPLSDKSSSYVLCSGEAVIWVVGHTIGTGVLADASSNRILRAQQR